MSGNTLDTLLASIDFSDTLQADEQLLDILSDVILNPDHVEFVHERATHLIPKLIERAIQNHGNCEQSRNRTNCIAFARLVERNPELIKHILPYFDRNGSPFQTKNFEEIPVKRRRTRENEEDLSTIEVLRSTYVLLSAAFDDLSRKWRFAELFDFLQSGSEEAKWYTIQILSLVLKVPRQTIPEISRRIINENFSPPRHPGGTYNEEDLSELLKEKSSEELVEKLKEKLSTITQGQCKRNSGESSRKESKGNLQKVPKDKSRESRKKFVETESSQRNLENLLLGLDSGKPILVEGALGVGKTFLIEYAAEKMNAELVKLQMSEETDVKGLIGYYKCTEIPGEFVWTPGVLYESLVRGHWLLLEDFDHSSPDIVSLLRNFTSSTSSLPNLPLNFHEIHRNFRLFLTSRDVSTRLSNFHGLRKRFYRVRLREFGDLEIETLVNDLFPTLTSISGKLRMLFRKFDGEFGANPRTISLRDLMRFCQRIKKDFDVSSPECAVKVLKDACDLFCCWVPDKELRLELSSTAASILGLPSAKSEHYLYSYKPQVQESKQYLQIGRAVLPKTKTDANDSSSASSNYCFTRQSSSLLEKVACALTNSEPVLLVGETGTGKTSSVQFLARRTLNKLRVLNLSQQSEPADLLGGFKPTDVKLLIAPVREEFEVLFRNYYALGPNRQFLENLGGCFEKRKWRVLVKLMLHCTKAALKRMAEEIEDIENELKEADNPKEKLKGRIDDLSDELKEVEYSKGKLKETKYLKVQQKGTKHLKKDSPKIENTKTESKEMQHSKINLKEKEESEQSRPKRVKLQTIQSSPKQPSGDTNTKRKGNTGQEAGDSPKRRRTDEKSVDRNSLKCEILKKRAVVHRWTKLSGELEKLSSKLTANVNLAFKYVEGVLLQCLESGDWLLLDEINLASPETLETLNAILECDVSNSSTSGKSNQGVTLTLPEMNQPIRRHPNFRLFGSMNPASDAGKRNLPASIRDRFTEFYFDESLEREELNLLVNSYLRALHPTKQMANNIVEFYLKVKRESSESLLDGTSKQPNFSLRSLCRALALSAENRTGNFIRSIFEGFSLSFLTQLDEASYARMKKLILGILPGKKEEEILRVPIAAPLDGGEKNYVKIGDFWVRKGSEVPKTPEDYIITPTVRRNLRDLSRIVSLSELPVLLQGDTSCGKTSLIDYLAKSSGNRCVRINNHEHTDLQEYIGNYVASGDGRLEFREGVLVDAMRKGYWIILDELNLAPTDILEALNRLLDDNRELFIPETQCTVRPHRNFRLFATQNPPGLYGGRKVLSRAFRNRFIELHFSDIPRDELKVILEKRCRLPKSYAGELVEVLGELWLRRRSTATFAGKTGFITLRDLFRWAQRYTDLAAQGDGILYDYKQHLAEEGYLVLSSKLRDRSHHEELIEVLQKHLKRRVEPSKLFRLNEDTSPLTRSILQKLLNFETEKAREGAGYINSDTPNIVWTSNLLRTAVLVLKSLEFREPVLLIGETGCGKTTICQFLALLRGCRLRSVNCHLNSEAQDFIGSLRPAKNADPSSKKLFEWQDGPLINAMREGSVFLADEINMADDSVLERLNSLLEPERRLLITENLDNADRGDVESIEAAENFVFLGTMNPAGDFGKKELSPALRNRFSEIWCESINTDEDLLLISEKNLEREPKLDISRCMVDFLSFLKSSDFHTSIVVSTRDLIAWIAFVNSCSEIEIGEAYFHGACLCFLDGVGCGNTGNESHPKRRDFIFKATELLLNQCRSTLSSPLKQPIYFSRDVPMDLGLGLVDDAENFGVPPFLIEKPNNLRKRANGVSGSFDFNCATTLRNLTRIMRAMKVRKPILIEGSPGVGKTSLVEAIGVALGIEVVRINLSEQTDISDLFGADLPVEGGRAGQFEWKDGPLLKGLRTNSWILLDELNLANQSVLEGLNACFDHREEIFIPELGRSFKVSRETRFFACQNPVREGGDRRGLPRSFLNRFTQVYVDSMTSSDYLHITSTSFPIVPRDCIEKLIKLNERLRENAAGMSNVAFEYNLRDIFRFCELRKAGYSNSEAIELLYVGRLRTARDREKATQLYLECFGDSLENTSTSISITNEKIVFGNIEVDRNSIQEGDHSFTSEFSEKNNYLLLRSQAKPLRDVASCVKMGWLCILVGPTASGKTTLVQTLANLLGKQLHCLPVNQSMDTLEILGGFEQTDYNRHYRQYLEETEELLLKVCRVRLINGDFEKLAYHYKEFETIKSISTRDLLEREPTTTKEVDGFLKKTGRLLKFVEDFLPESHKPCGFEEEFDELSLNLRSLLNTVKEERCLNAGGKFEWIESVLVKCVRKGGWLLLTDTNLTTAAVLDRLNCLLEKNGKLIIGERGVDLNGEIEVIEPHKDFRLFMAMDPRHGEISRAMRNRGVELFIEEPSPLSPTSLLDFRSLLDFYGLRQIALQNLVLQAFNVADNNILNVLDLVKLASATRQRRNVDSSEKKTFEMAFSDVFEDNPVGLENLMLDANHVVLKHLTPSLVSTKMDFHLSRVKWEAFLMELAMALRSNQQSLDLNAFFGIETGIQTLPDLLPTMFLEFWQRLRQSDFEIRMEYLKRQVLSNSTDFERQMRRILEEIKPGTIDGSYQLKLLLHFIIMIEEEGVDDEKDHMSISSYSEAVCKGELQSQLKNDYLITNFHTILSTLSDFLLHLLKEPALEINNMLYLSVMQQVSLIKRLRAIGALPLIDRSRGRFVDFRPSNSILRLHLHWIEKRLVRPLTELCETIPEHLLNSRQLIDRVNEIFRQIDASFSKNRLGSLQKHLRKYLGDESTKLSSSRVKLIERLLTLRKEHEIGREDFGDHGILASKVNLIRRQGFGLLRKAIYDGWDLALESYGGLMGDHIEGESSGNITNIPNSNDNTNRSVVPIISIDTSTTNTISSTGNPPRTPETLLQTLEDLEHELKNSENHEFDKTDVKNFAFLELYCIVFAKHLLKNLSESIVSNTTIAKLESARKVVLFFEELPMIPARLISDLKFLLSSGNLNENRELLMNRLFIDCVELEENSLVKNGPGLMLEIDEIEENPKGALEYAEHRKAVISNSSINNLLLDFINSRSSTPSFGNHRQAAHQISLLCKTNFLNSFALFIKDFNLDTNGSIILCHYRRKFVEFVEKCRDLIEETESRFSDSELLQFKEDFQRFYVELVKSDRDFGKSIKNSDSIILEDIDCIEESATANDANPSNNTDNNDNDTRKRSAKDWILLGYLNFHLFHSLDIVDPLKKRNLKRIYLNEFKDELENCVKIERIQNLIISSEEGGLFEAKLQRLEELLVEQEKNKGFNDFERDPEKFENFRDNLMDLHRSLVNTDSIIGILSTIDNLLTISKTSSVNKEVCHSKLVIWRESLNRFSTKLESQYSSQFPELVLPILFSLCCFRQGLNIVQQWEDTRLLKESNEYLAKYLSFPVIPTNADFEEFLRVCCSGTASDTKTKFGQLKVALCELKNLAAARGELDKNSRIYLERILRDIYRIWQWQEETVHRRRMEEDSLYKHKAQNEEQEMERDFRENFYDCSGIFEDGNDDSMSDINSTTWGTIPTTNSNSHSNTDGVTSSNDEVIMRADINDVFEDFKSILTSSKTSNTAKNYSSNLRDKFRIVENMLPTGRYSGRVHCTLSFLLNAEVASSECNTPDSSYNFYKDSNLKEIEASLPHFQRLGARISELLDEFPENPLLLEILSIQKRISKFPIHSPLPRFLYAFEVLAQKIQSWEENAIHTVSLMEFLLYFSKKILDLRKIEAQRWKSSLDFAEDELRARSNKFYFLLQGLLLDFLQVEDEDDKLIEIEENNKEIVKTVEKHQETQVVTTEKVEDGNQTVPIQENQETEGSTKVQDENGEKKEDDSSKSSGQDAIYTLKETLDKFIMGSPLIEFESRLSLLRLFSTYLSSSTLPMRDNSTVDKTELSSLLFNMHRYYSQYSNIVKDEIRRLRKPIERKLKDQIKIARWTESGFHLARMTSEKTRRTIHRLVKRFEKEISVPIAGMNFEAQEASVVITESCFTDANVSDVGIIQDKNSKNTTNASANAKGKDIANVGPNGKNIVPNFYNTIYNSDVICNTYLTDTLVSTTDPSTDPLSTQSINDNPLELQGVKYSKRSLEFTRTILFNNRMPILIKEIEDFFVESYQESVELRRQVPEASLEKEKQLKFQKSLIQRKKMALTNYFKSLNDLGLSARTGILKLKNRKSTVFNFGLRKLDFEDYHYYFTNCRVDDSNSNSNSNTKSIKSSNNNIMKFSDDHYYKSLINLERLEANLYSRACNLGADAISKCLGYTAHQILLLNDLKTSINETLEEYLPLELQITNITSLNPTFTDLKCQENVSTYFDELKNLIFTLEIGVNQVEAFMKTIPQGDYSKILNLNSKTALIDSTGEFKMNFESLFDYLHQSLVNIHSSLDFEFKKVEKLREKSRKYLLHEHHLQLLGASVEELKKVWKSLELLAGKFGEHCIVDTLRHLMKLINKSTRRFEEIMVNKEDIQESSEIGEKRINFEAKLQEVIEMMLVAIQEKYKRSLDILKSEKADEEQDQLTRKVLGGLRGEVKELNLKKVNKDWSALMEQLYEMSGEELQRCFRLLLSHRGVLASYHCIARFYLNQSIHLFNSTSRSLYLQTCVFLLLSRKAFCAPEELKEHEKNVFKDTDGSEPCGLEDATPENSSSDSKDVSSKIEDLDQLEDAKRPEDRTESKDNNSKDKGKGEGIEVDDDFESKLEDVEDDEENNDDPDDLEDEVGKVGGGSGKLDKALWSDEEEDEEDKDDNPDDKNEENNDAEGGDGSKDTRNTVKDNQEGDTKGNDNADENSEDGGNGEDTNLENSSKDDAKASKGSSKSNSKEYADGNNEEGNGDDNERNDESVKNNEEGMEIEDFQEVNEDHGDQTDNYHGNFTNIEPEIMDLPDDMNLDGDGGNMDEEHEDSSANPDTEGNPFDIDAMKDQNPKEKEPTEDTGEAENANSKEETEGNVEGEDSDSEEEAESTNAPKNVNKSPDIDEENKENSNVNSNTNSKRDGTEEESKNSEENSKDGQEKSEKEQETLQNELESSMDNRETPEDDRENPERVGEDPDGAENEPETSENNQETSRQDEKDPEIKETPENEDNDQGANDKPVPSRYDHSDQQDNSGSVGKEDTSSKDRVNESDPSGKSKESAEELMETSAEAPEDGDDKGHGQSSTSTSDGHQGESRSQQTPSSKEKSQNSERERQKPGASRENRSLADSWSKDVRRLEILDSKDPQDSTENNKTTENKVVHSDLYRNTVEDEEEDDVGMDAAKEDQLNTRLDNLEDKEDPEKSEKIPEETAELVDEGKVVSSEEDVKDVQEKMEKADRDPEKVETAKSSSKSKQKSTSTKTKLDNEEVDIEYEVSGDITETEKVGRIQESEYFTNLDRLASEMLQSNVQSLRERRKELEELLGRRNTEVKDKTTEASGEVDCHELWKRATELTSSSARELSEKLRLVLEPLVRGRLCGDFKTGRRLNMRKIISYVASEFRKDRIWLRRARPSRRNYQITVAVDDSSSMADSHSQELAFESLSLISQALVFLEAGELSVLSFGEDIEVLHPLGECFTNEAGARLIERMKFDQKKTMVGKLVDFSVETFLQRSSTGTDNSRLLLILSDGRGIYSEGVEKVNSAIRRAKLANIFLVFIIVDNPANKDSILDIRMPVFEHGRFTGIKQYMDNFPFPFYIILRDLENLPNVLSDALRQWFEIVGRHGEQ